MQVQLQQALKVYGNKISQTHYENVKLMGGQAENQQIMTLVRIENEVMREKLGMLFNAMAVLGDTKNIQDQFAAEKIRLDEEVFQIKKEILELETNKLETEQKFSESLMIIHDLMNKVEVIK